CPPKAHDVMAAAVGEAVLAAAAMVAAAEAAQQECNSHIATPRSLLPNPTLSKWLTPSPAQLASCPLASCSFPLLSHHHHLQVRNLSTSPHPSGQPGAGARPSCVLLTIQGACGAPHPSMWLDLLSMTVMHTRENLHDFMLSPRAPVFVHLALKSVTESPEPLEGEGGQAA
ncbi:hypothetical protein QJQ45_023401, partial [Haematococcus lacustris]